MNNDLPVRFDMENRQYDVYYAEYSASTSIHWHDHFVYTLYDKGSGAQILNGRKYDFKPGTVIILSPVDFHNNTIAPGSTYSSYGLRFSYEIIIDSLHNICSLDLFPIVIEFGESDLNLARDLFKTLINEKNNENLIGNTIYVRSLIEQLIILALRTLNKNTAQKISDSTIRKALLYIHTNFRNPLNISDVAEKVYLSSNYFSSRFHKSTGITFQDYLIDLRLDFSMNLLKYSELAITEICFTSGFNSLSHFSTTFKKKFGFPPAHFKKAL